MLYENVKNVIIINPFHIPKKCHNHFHIFLCNVSVIKIIPFPFNVSERVVSACLFIVNQGGITCEAIDEPGKSSKAIDKRVIINFRDKNVVIARFRDKNEVFVPF